MGKLCQTTASNGYSRTQSYDSLGRPAQTAVTIDAQTHNIVTSYDAQGRVARVSYPSGFAVSYVYTALGYLTELRDGATSAALWTANARDAELRLTQQTAGNGIVTTRSFDALTGLITGIAAGPSNSVADFSYGWDTLGNLTSRADATQSLNETFTYDILNRLVSYAIQGGATKTVSFDDLGNITSKSDTGTRYPFSSHVC